MKGAGINPYRELGRLSTEEWGAELSKEQRMGVQKINAALKYVRSLDEETLRMLLVFRDLHGLCPRFADAMEIVTEVYRERDSTVGGDPK